VNFPSFDRPSGSLKIGLSKPDSRGCRWWRSCCHGSLSSYSIQARESFASCVSVVPANTLSLQAYGMGMQGMRAHPQCWKIGHYSGKNFEHLGKSYSYIHI